MITYGTIVKKTKNKLILLEYDEILDDDIKVIYKIEGDVECRNVKSFSDIHEGDVIELNYEEKINKKIVISIKQQAQDHLVEDDDYEKENFEYDDLF